MTHAEVIREVLDLLDTSDKWVKFAEGETAEGEATLGHDPRAVKWCLGGAIVKVTGIPWYLQFEYDGTMQFLDRRAHDEGWRSFVEFNNSPSITFEDIRLFLKRALIEAEEME